MTDPKYKRGDWVRWLSMGVIRIGEVRYIRDQWPASSEPEYVTDCGAVNEGRILEVRVEVPQ